MKKRVLFLCIGNSCRSQMAEGFARCYGLDVMDCESAGLAPAGIVQPLTKKVMEDKNINIDHQYPKDLAAVDVHNFDLVINMSGNQLPPSFLIEVREWKVEDPICRPEEIYIKVRDQIEMSVMQLVLEFRREAKKSQPKPARPRRKSPTVANPQ
jgi:arsenate reductase (thioredoxin)